ncbi:MAG: hypothetical protein WBG01_03585 [Bacteroidota bacterium]|jgi:hypothetical protein
MTKTTDTGMLVDLALGNLSPEDSLRIMEELENDEERSELLEVILGIRDWLSRHAS